MTFSLTIYLAEQLAHAKKYNCIEFNTVTFIKTNFIT